MPAPKSYLADSYAGVADGSGLSRGDMTFLCWNTRPDGKGLCYEPEEFILMDKDITLYADWYDDGRNHFRLFYRGNGATDGMVPQDNHPYYGGEEVTTADKGDLSKRGWVFKEWNTKPDGTGISYTPNMDKVKMPRGNVFLFAIWIYEGSDNPGTAEPIWSTAAAWSLTILSLLTMGASALRLEQNRRRADSPR